MEQQTSFLLLKILSGPHKGAEMELTPGDWTMGSSSACDLVLSDQGVMEEHLLLRVEEDASIVLHPLHGAAVLLDGAPLPEEGASLLPYVVFSLGETQACTGPVKEAWPEISLPVPVQLSISEVGKEDGSSAGDSAEAASALPDPPPAPLEIAPEPFASTTAPRPQRWKTWASLACVAVLLMALMTGTSGLGLFAPSTPEEQLEVVQQALRAGGFGALEVVRTPQGQLQISGVVPLPADLTRLEGVVQSLEPTVNPGTAFRVVVAETLAREVRDTIKQAGAKLRVDRSGVRLRISGYIYDAAQLEALLAPHMKAFADVPLKLEPLYWAELSTELKRISIIRQLQELVRFEPTAFYVLVRAQSLSSLKKGALAQLEAEVTDLAQGVSPFERPSARGTAPATPVSATLKVETPQPLCQSLHFIPGVRGGISGLRLNNEVYQEGGRLPGGYRISELTPRYAVLIREGNNILICRNTANQHKGE